MANNFIVCDGDSITFGIGVTLAYPEQLNLNSPWSIQNIGINAETLNTMLTNAPSTVDTYFISGRTNLVVIWGGTNDFGQGATVASVYSTLQSYCTGRRSAGFKVIVVTMLSRVGNNPTGGETLDADKNAYNALIRANWASFSDGLADVAANSNLGADGAYANSTYFQGDEIHPTQLSVTTISAPIISTAINALNAPEPIPTPGGAYMPLSVVTFSVGGTNAGATTASSAAFSASNGNLLVVAVRGFVAVASITGVTDTAGNTFTQIPGSSVFSSGLAGATMFYAKNITGNAANVVVGHFNTSAAANGICVWQVLGALTTSPLDTSSFGTASAASTVTSGSYSTGQSTEIVCVMATSNTTGLTFSGQSGYTLDSNGFPTGVGGQYCGAEHIIFNSTQNAITSSMGLSPAENAILTLAAFKAAPVAAGSVRPWIGPKLGVGLRGERG